MRERRKTHPLTREQAVRDNARSYAGVYLRRGKIERESCVVCDCPDAQMHHEDYSKPTEVTWLCRPCHLALHRNEIELPQAWPDNHETPRIRQLEQLVML